MEHITSLQKRYINPLNDKNIDNDILRELLQNPNPYIRMLGASQISNDDLYYTYALTKDPYINHGLSKNENFSHTTHFENYINFNEDKISNDIFEELLINQKNGIWLAKNYFTPIIFLEKMCTLYDLKIMNELAKNRRINDKIIKFIIDFGSEESKMHLAKNPIISLDIMNYFSEFKSEKIKSGLAQNFNCPLEIRQKFIKDPFCEVKYNLVFNPSLTTPELFQLAQDYNAKIRRLVAWRTENQDILTLLSDDMDSEIKEILALKLKSENLLLSLSSTSNKKVLNNLSLNLNNSSNNLDLIINKEVNFHTLKCLAYHQNLSLKTAIYLLLLKNQDIDEIMAINTIYPEIIHPLFERYSNGKIEMINLIASNSNTPEDILLNIYNKKINHEYIAANKNLPHSLINQIMIDHRFDTPILKNLARYTKDESVLWQLFKKDHIGIFEELAKNINSPSLLLSHIPGELIHITKKNPNWKSQLDTILDIIKEI